MDHLDLAIGDGVVAAAALDEALGQMGFADDAEMSTKGMSTTAGRGWSRNCAGGADCRCSPCTTSTRQASRFTRR
jgi:hypothetical protein